MFQESAEQIMKSNHLTTIVYNRESFWLDMTSETHEKHRNSEEELCARVVNMSEVDVCVECKRDC